MSLTIATVLKLGGDYDVSYVNHIANSISEHVSIPYEFVCLTDATDGFCTNVHKIIQLEHNFPKWWGKLELFKPDKFSTDRVFYIDLDTIIVDNIDDIMQYTGDFFGLKDFYKLQGLGSGLMAWGASNTFIQRIYHEFMRNPTANMNNHRYGDQEFIGKLVARSMDYVQELYPRKIVSYKKDCVDPYGNVHIPDDAAIICFHGRPRPHQANFPEIQEHWKG